MGFIRKPFAAMAAMLLAASNVPVKMLEAVSSASDNPRVPSGSRGTRALEQDGSAQIASDGTRYYADKHGSLRAHRKDRTRTERKAWRCAPFGLRRSNQLVRGAFGDNYGSRSLFG